MSALEVLPRALLAAGRAVRTLDLQPVRPADLGDAGLSDAFAAYVRAWSGVDLVGAAERCGRALEGAAQEYQQVEAALVPRALR